MPTRKTLKASLKANRQRLPHGYELVARKKRVKVTKHRTTKRKRK
jgi:hypothetical protein